MSKYFIITLINLLIFNNIYAFSYTSLDASPESDAIDWSKKNTCSGRTGYTCRTREVQLSVDFPYN